MKSYPLIEIVDYDSAWEMEFQATRKQIESVAGSLLIGVEHIGSTAVKGLAAKPIIDVVAAPYRFPDAVNLLIAPFAAIGFEYVPKSRSDKYFFRRGKWGHGTHHLHVVEHEGEDWQRQVLFRDWLRSHPAVVLEYQRLKRQLALIHETSRPSYKNAKTEFIYGVLEDARRSAATVT